MWNIVQHCSTLFNIVITSLLTSKFLVLIMQKVETLAIALCVFTLAGFAMYAIDILNLPGTDDLIQQADAIRRSTHQCIPPNNIVGCL
jgi:hypothetical protein